jgi:hypothetical protein
MKGCGSGWAYSSVADLVDFERSLHKQRLRDIKASDSRLDTKLSRRTNEYGSWRTSTPRWVEDSQQRRTKERSNLALSARIRGARASVDTCQGGSTVKYRGWRAKQPRWQPNSCRKVHDEALMRRHNHRIQSARAKVPGPGRRTTPDNLDPRLDDYAAFREAQRNARVADGLLRSPRRGSRNTPWRPSSPKPKAPRARSAPVTRSTVDTRAVEREAEQLAAAIIQSGVHDRDASGTYPASRSFMY